MSPFAKLLALPGNASSARPPENSQHRFLQKTHSHQATSVITSLPHCHNTAAACRLPCTTKTSKRLAMLKPKDLYQARHMPHRLYQNILSIRRNSADSALMSRNSFPRAALLLVLAACAGTPCCALMGCVEEPIEGPQKEAGWLLKGS